MKIVLALAVALGVPLGALAQPRADGGGPTEVPGVTADLPNSAMVEGLAATAACPLPPPGSATAASKVFDAPTDANPKRTEPSAGTRDWLKQTVAMFASGTMANAPKMDVGLTRVTQEQFKGLSLWVTCRGALKSIKFLHVSAMDYDDYEVEFAKGAIEWDVAPLNASGQAYQSAIRFYYPQPATRQFGDFLDSLLRGRPNYADLTPEFAAAVQAQWPELQKVVKAWGNRGLTVFVRQADDGSYLFVTGFKHSNVVWEVAPLDDHGKIAGLKYAEAEATSASPGSSRGACYGDGRIAFNCR